MRDLFAIAKFLLTIGRLLLHCWYSLGRPVTIGTPMVISVLFWLYFDCEFNKVWVVWVVFDCFWRLVHCWYSLDLLRLVHQWFLLFWLSFDCYWLFLTIGTPLVHCWYSLGRPVTIGTPMFLSVFDYWYNVPFVKSFIKIDLWQSQVMRSGICWQHKHLDHTIAQQHIYCWSVVRRPPQRQFFLFYRKCCWQLNKRSVLHNLRNMWMT